VVYIKLFGGSWAMEYAFGTGVLVRHCYELAVVQSSKKLALLPTSEPHWQNG
jgi:hypothetical protein